MLPLESFAINEPMFPNLQLEFKHVERYVPMCFNCRESEIRRQQIFGIKLINHLYRLFRLVHQIEEMEVSLVDHFFRDQYFLDPINQAAPEFFSHQHNRKTPDFFCLNEGY